MATTNQAVRLMDRQIVKANYVGPGVDLREYATLEVSFQMLDAGGSTAGAIFLQHAAVDEEGAYTQLGVALDLFGAAPVVSHQSLSFLGYVRWTTNANVNGQPLAAIEIIAKEH